MQELDKFKNEMNLSGKNVYVGHRYVPKIMGEWDNSQIYEPLSIVQYQGNSFTSRQYVPVGVEILNEEFWASTGNYNAQVEQYRQEVRNLETDVDNFTSEVNKQLGNITITPEMFGAIGDGVQNDTKALQLAFENTGGNTLKFDQTKIYAFDKKIIINGLRDFVVDFNGATLLDLGDTIPADGGHPKRNPVGIKFLNCDNFSIKGLIHDTKNMEFARVANEDAHLKSASVEFNNCTNFDFEQPIFKGSQGSIPMGGYVYYMTLDEALNFGHLKVYQCENVEVKAFTLDGGVNGNEVLLFGESKNIRIKYSKKTDDADLTSWGKFIKCKNLTFENTSYSSNKETSFIDASGDNIRLKNIDINYPNGKLLDVTNEWGEIGGELNDFYLENIKGIVSTGVFCSVVNEKEFPEFKDYFEFADFVSVTNAQLTGNTFISMTSRMKNIIVKDSTLKNFKEWLSTRVLTENGYAGKGEYYRKFQDVKFIITEDNLYSEFRSEGRLEFDNCYFNGNWNEMEFRDWYEYRYGEIEDSGTIYEFTNTKFENIYIRMEGNMKFKNCEFINCIFTNSAVEGSTQVFSNCIFDWNEEHFINTNYEHIFRTLSSQKVEFLNCEFMGKPRFNSSFLINTGNRQIDGVFKFKRCAFDIDRAINIDGETGGSYVFKMDRRTINDVAFDVIYEECTFDRSMIMAQVTGYSSPNIKRIRLEASNCTSKQTQYTTTIRYSTGADDPRDLSKYEMVLINNVLSNSEQIINTPTENFAKYVDINNHAYTFSN